MKGKHNFFTYGLVVALTTISFSLFAESDAAKENKALFNGVVNKLYGKQAENIENNVKKMHANRDAAIESATGGDELDSDMKEMADSAQKLMDTAEALQTNDPQKIEAMKNSLPPELQAKLMGGGAEGTDAVELGLMQVLDMFRDMSQYQVENYLKLAWVPNEKDPENFFVKNPKVITYAATVLRDKDAIPSFFAISKHKMKLLFFLIFLIASFLLSKLLVRFYNRNVSVLIAIGRFFVRSFTFYSLRLIFFCYLFYDQMAPMGKLVRSFIIDYFTT